MSVSGSGSGSEVKAMNGMVEERRVVVDGKSVQEERRVVREMR